MLEGDKVKIDFYLLSVSDRNSVLHFTCRLAEKAFHARQSVFILTANQAETEGMDKLLWAFRPDSFMPHVSQGLSNDVFTSSMAEEKHLLSAVFIDNSLSRMKLPNEKERCVLISLDGNIISDNPGFSRVCHVISSNEQEKQQGRSLFAEYKKAGTLPDVVRL